MGALIIRIGFWGTLYNNYNKGTQNNVGNWLGPYIISLRVRELSL